MTLHQPLLIELYVSERAVVRCARQRKTADTQSTADKVVRSTKLTAHHNPCASLVGQTFFETPAGLSPCAQLASPHYEEKTWHFWKRLTLAVAVVACAPAVLCASAAMRGRKIVPQFST